MGGVAVIAWGGVGRAAERQVGVGRGAHLVVLVVDAEALTEVAEDLGAVLLELEVAGEVLPGGAQRGQ